MIELASRLQALEDADSIRRCMNRYMALCDRLSASTPVDELLDCFCEDAVWRGKGSRYGRSFGCLRGRQAIGEMFSRYMRTPAHFSFNAHFLTTENIALLEPKRADASWLMLQTSTFSDGRSHLNAAHLDVGLRRDPDGRWRIARFETENLFSRPLDYLDSSIELPVPDA